MRFIFKLVFSKLFLSAVLVAAYIGGIVAVCILLPAIISMGAAVLAAFVLSLAAAACASAEDSPAEIRCGKLLMICALPVLGAAIYFTAGRKRSAPPLPPAVPCGYERCEYFDGGTSFFEALFREIDGAKESVVLEFYIFAKGAVADALCTKLADALKRGVSVRIMTDALGSALRLPKKQLKRLKKMGARVKIFNALVPPPLSKLNCRDHTKLAVIDKRAAFSGGINIGDEYAGLTHPHGQWKDGGFAIYGSGAGYFFEMFEYMWQGKTPVAPDICNGERVFLPVVDRPPSCSGRCEGEICRMIERAERRIWILTPYLCPDERVFSALCRAAERKVDVRIILPAVPDKRSVYRLTLDCAARLSEHGAGVFAWSDGFMHAKAVIADGECLLGSYNLDCRSLWLNHECGALLSGDITEEVAGDFLETLALSEKITGRKRKLARPFYTLA